MLHIRSVGDVIAIMRRHVVMIGLITIIGTVASYFFAVNMPRSYSASALFQIETPRTMSDDPRGGTRISSAYWLQLVQARLMVRDNMLDVIQQFDLFRDTPNMDVEQQIRIFISSIRIETVTGGMPAFGAEQWPGVLRVVTTMPSAQLAADVANELAEKVLDMNASTQTERAIETLQFYSQEEERILSQIEGVENEMAAFRNANLDYLPTALDNRPLELRAIDEELSELDGQLLEERAKLTEMMQRPSLSTIEQRSQERITSQIQLLMTRQAQLRDRADAIRGSGQRTANAEAQMDSFNRRLLLLREQLAEATRRRAAAETAQRLDAEYRGDQFILLERAIPPLYPQESGRRKVMVLGAGAAFGLALVLALLIEMMRPVLRSAGQIESASGLRPVVTLPELSNSRET